MLLVADSHISTENGNGSSFLAMLEAISRTDEGVVFLGDIFDLWIALPRYETGLHEAFSEWCLRESSRRTIGFVEGNHEFFVVDRYAGHFTFSSRDAVVLEGSDQVFVHGDTIDGGNWGHRVFRWVTKSAFARLVLRLMPAGPAFAHWIRRTMASEGQEDGRRVPRDEVARFAQEWFDAGARQVFAGHFHEAFRYDGGQGCRCWVLPQWGEEQRIGRWEPASEELEVGPWDAILKPLMP